MVVESQRRTTAEADIVSFASLSGAWTPIHSDELLAVASPLDGRVAHGPMMIGIVFGLLSRLELLDGTCSRFET